MSNVIAVFFAPCRAFDCSGGLFAYLMPLKSGLLGGVPSLLRNRGDGQLSILLLALSWAPLGIALFLRSRNGKPGMVRTSPILKLPVRNTLTCWIARRWSRSSGRQATEADRFEKSSRFIEKMTDTLPGIL